MPHFIISLTIGFTASAGEAVCHPILVCPEARPPGFACILVAMLLKTQTLGHGQRTLRKTRRIENKVVGDHQMPS
jgi:hypothetical protein